jgi:Mannosyl-glycoprotein endo-beta-N-acetylglucosaminidase
MASGSYARKPSPQAPLEEEIIKQIPARATRQLRTVKESMQDNYDSGPETMPTTAPTRLPQKTPRQKAEQKRTLPPRAPVAVATNPRQVDLIVHHAFWLKPWVLCMVGAICFLAILISAGMFQRPTSSFISNDGQAYNIQVGGNQAGTWEHPATPVPVINPQSGPYGVLGKPSLNVAFINQVLSTYNSPAAGKGQALYDLGVQYGIDPAFALAFFMHESTFGTKGEATKSLSLGNIRCIPNFRCEDNFAQFDTWEDGFKAWYELIRNLYVAQWGLTTVDLIIPRYAPPSDNNNDDAYINSLKHALDTWHAGQIIVS